MGLAGAADADPRDLSGGERQRLALAIALAGRTEGAELPGLVALDEPTRGMDRARKGELIELIDGLAQPRRGGRRRHPRRRVRRRLRHRVALLGDGVAIATGRPRRCSPGGWYFATEVARILDAPGVIAPGAGAACLSASRSD